MTDPTARSVSRSDAGVLELLRRFRDNQPTADEYATGRLQKTKALEPALKAFEYMPVDTARRPGPLSGIPVAIKDIIATSDMPTTNGSPVYAGQVPAANAWVVERLRNLGRQSSAEDSIDGIRMATSGADSQPQVRPYAGGSSPFGGRRCGGLIPGARHSNARLIIRPAAFNGIVGFKPVSRHPSYYASAQSVTESRWLLCPPAHSRLRYPLAG